MDKVYVVGHLTPDTDTIVAAMSLAAFLNARERTNRYVAVMTGKQNSETDYIFKQCEHCCDKLTPDILHVIMIKNANVRLQCRSTKSFGQNSPYLKRVLQA